MSPKIAIVGGGAAGCFCSIELKRRMPDSDVTVFEAGPKPMAKLAVTGGGRCNLTNSFENIGNISEAYPRGAQLMRRALSFFSNEDTCRWFEKEGVRLLVQEDCCVFPVSQDAMQIVGTLASLMKRLGVNLLCSSKVSDLTALFEKFDFVVLCSGGGAVKMLDKFDIKIEKLVPSLFSFNLQDDPIRNLAGTVVEKASAGIQGTKFKSYGPLLVTDWGMSGPAVLKLSSYAARYMSECNYDCYLNVNWTGDSNQDTAAAYLKSFLVSNGNKMLSSVHPPFLTSRLWNYLVKKSGIREDLRCSEAGMKTVNKLCNTLVSDSYHVCGKNRFKDEFVTCGGVSLSEINLSTCESKKYPGLFFAGEVLDVDAITGGFNLQAAWSTAMLAADAISVRTSFETGHKS